MDAKRRPRIAFELVFATAALVTTLPLFAGRYIPLQDLPQHVAAVRVLHDYRVPELGFERFFQLSLGSTQYLSVYLLAHLLAYATGVLLAMKLVLAASLVGLPYALRALLRALGRPESLALFALPLAYNAHLVLGFSNFIAALPLLFWGLAFAVRTHCADARGAQVGLCVVAFACFYTHVIPYAMLVMGVLLVATKDAPRAALRRGLPLVPSFIGAAVWLGASPAVAELAKLASEEGEGALRLGRPFWAALGDAPLWLTDVFGSGQGRGLLVGWCLLALFVVSIRKSPWLDAALSRFRASGALASQPPEPLVGTAPTTRRLLLLVPIALLGYWTLPESYSFMWPIHGRFPLLALVCCIPLLPVQSLGLRSVTALGCIGLAGYGTLSAWQAFRGAVEHEYAGLSEVIAEIPQGSRVAGLIFSAGSRYVRFSPYLHAVAWAQAERGGAVQFSFADFPASPFHFREDNRPPRVPPRWEWMPGRVDPARDLVFFDYVLTRSGPLRLPGFYGLRRSGDWSLFRRPGAD